MCGRQQRLLRIRGARRHSLTNMVSRADQCNSIGTCSQATQRSKSRKKFRHLGSTEPFESRGRIIFLSFFNEIEWSKRGNEKKCLENAKEVTEHAKQFQSGHWCFCGLGQERVWHRTSSDTPTRKRDRIARKMTQKFEDASHPIFYCAEPFWKGDFKSKKGKETIHS